MKKLRELIPKQHELTGTLGGAKLLLQRVGIYLAFINWIMISRIFWDSSALAQQIFLGKYMFFLFGGLGMIVLVAVFLEYTFMLPSELRFAQHQVSKGGRSPIYEGIREANEKIDDINSKLNNEMSEIRIELEGIRKKIGRLET